LYAQSPALGYVKPLFRRSLLAKLRYPYDETLPIAEDYDLLVRLLLAGARLRTIPYAGYYYRRHVGSTSHRLSGEAIRAMLAADARLSDAAPLSASITKALGRRRASIERAARFHEMASLAKRSRFGQLALAIVSAPRSALLFRVPLRDRTNKLVTAFSRFLG
jgi:succinoglycan biosynthesis protein ExoO